jgi:hypothetical protein
MLKTTELENELRKWREARAKKQATTHQVQARQAQNDRRTVRVNGQEVVVITKAKRPLV